MVDETDGIEDAFEGQMRVLISAAGQAGEQVARLRESALRRAQERSEQETRELQSRIEAERRAGRAELGNVHRAEWWAGATPEQIGHAYQVARAWAAEDPEAVRAEQRMRDELRTRYGVDVEVTNADPASVRAAMDRGERDRAEADAERTRAAAENTETPQLMQEANRHDRAAVEHEQQEAAGDRTREDGRAMRDTAERRSATSRGLECKVLDHELVAIRMRADISQAKPPAHAVVDTSRAVQPRVHSARSHAAQGQRTGLSQ